MVRSGLAALIVTQGCLAGAAFAVPFVMNGTTYEVADIAGTGADKAVLEVDFGTNTSPPAYLFGYQWDGSTSPNGRDLLLALQGDSKGLTFTDTFFASFGEFALNTLWYNGNQPADDYPNAFWLYFSGMNGQTWTETDTGYDQVPVNKNSFYAWSLQHDDPNFGRDFSLPPLDPSHTPTPIVNGAVAAPEPATMTLAAAGVVLLATRRRR